MALAVAPLPRTDFVIVKPWIKYVVAVAAMMGSRARAADPLPYTTRQHSYNGFTTGALGDIRTVGMAGATLGLADTFLAATNNPAGCSMTLGIIDTNITGTSIHDGHVQNVDSVIDMKYAAGIAVNLHPWGIILGIAPTGGEGQDYFLPAGAQAPYGGQPANLANRAYEFRVGASRVFFDNQLSLGASLNVGVGEEEIQLPQYNGFDQDHHASALGGTFGLMYQFPQRVLLGLSYSLPMHYRFDKSSTVVPNFVQSLDVPDRLELGIGWIPNRFLRGDIQISAVGKTPGAALLSDDTKFVGRNITLQPKLGGAYIFMDYHNFKGTFFGGTYYEVSRTDGVSNREHVTAGLEMKAWLVTAGIGIDAASQYHNLLLSIGADLGFILERLKIVPTAARPPYGHMVPNPFNFTDAGLARPLVKNWHPQGPDMDLVKIIEDVPKNTEKSIERIGKEIDDFERGPAAGSKVDPAKPAPPKTP